MLYRPKITYLLDDIGGIFNISNYTKNYLAYKYKLRKKDYLESLALKFEKTLQENKVEK